MPKAKQTKKSSGVDGKSSASSVELKAEEQSPEKVQPYDGMQDNGFRPESRGSNW